MGLCGSGVALPGGATSFFRAATDGHLTILEVPPAEDKRSRDKMPNQLENMSLGSLSEETLTLFITVI